MTNNQNNNFIILSLSTPTVNPNKSGFKSAIASSFKIKKFRYTPSKFLENMYNLDLKNIILIGVITSVSNQDSHYERMFIKNFSNDKKCNLKVLLINFERFFSLETLNYLFEENKEKSYEYIFFFENLNWKEICGYFFSCGIDISGGSNNKKHLLSPLQLKLSLFLSCVYGGSQASIEVKNSFHLPISDENKKELNYSIKEYQNKYIDFAKSNEMLKSRLLLDGIYTKKIEDLFDKSIEENAEIGTLIDTDKITDVAIENKNQNPNSEVKVKEETLFKLNRKGKIDRNFHTLSVCKLFHSEKRLHSNTNDEIKDPVSVSMSPVVQYDLDFSDKENELSISTIHPSTLNSKQIINSKSSKNLPSKSILSYYFKDIKDIIDKAVDLDEDGKREAQLKIEESWITLIQEKLKDEKYLIERYQGKVFSTVQSVKESLDIMKDNNYFNKKFSSLSRYADLNELEYILITYAICISLYSRFSYNALAIRVGEQILDYIYYNNIIKNKQTEEGSSTVKGINRIDREQFKELIGYTDKIEIFKLGDFFISVLQNYPHDLFTRKVKLDSFYTNEPYYLEINKDFVEELKNSLIVNPTTLPMICKPNSWSPNKFGGYLTNEFQREDIITGKDSSNHLVDNKESIYDSVNYLNSIEFGVNNLMLDYILSDEGSYLLDNIKAEDEMQRMLTLEVAKMYEKSKFYLNTHADFRGRIYTQSFFLSYQGGDLSVSLLNFWNGVPVNDEGKIYLYIYGCNSHNENGLSKCSFKERIDWVNKNYEKIINLDKELILKAESPFLFTVFCLNMREIHNNPGAVIKTPVFLDATCSGIQHLAGLMKDLELGVNTNLLPQTEDDIPEDIYSYLLNIINEAINNYGKEHIEYNILTFVKLERKHIKAPIMTKVYNVTKYGISRQLQAILKGEDVDLLILEEKEKVIDEISNELEENIKSNKKKTRFICPSNDGSNIYLNHKEIYKMAEIIDDQIFVVFPSLNSIYNYFIDVTKLTIKLDIPLNWITPSGLHITQRYLKMKKKVVSVNLFGKTKKFVIRKNEKDLNQNKQVQAIIPNIIHSLDASHLINLILSAKKDNFHPIISVHDCFGTLPNKMKYLDFKVKTEFINIYSQSNFLINFHERFIQNIKDNQFEIVNKDGKSFVVFDKGRNKRLFDIYPKELIEIPSVPQPGDLKIEEIINSKYMIS